MKNLKQEVTEITKVAKVTEEETAENQARAMVYSFLSSLFAKEVSAEQVAQLNSTQGQNFLASLAQEQSLAPHINIIRKKVEQLSDETLILELAADFCGLFLMDGKTCVSPYAGQYLINQGNNNQGNISQGNISQGNISQSKTQGKKDKLPLFGELHQLMTEFLTNSNMQIHKDFPEPADHIAVILAYLAHISLTASTESQLSFIEHYLMPWFDAFSLQVIKHDPDCFYSAVTELTLAWLKLETNSE